MSLPQLLIRPDTLASVQVEATYADRKHGDQSMFAPGQTNERRLAILAEEVGECARELNEAAIKGVLDSRHLREELIQVAAMATTWHDALLREET